MSKYEGRFKALERKLPREGSGCYYPFNEKEDGTYTDDCGNVYTAEEFEALTCNKMIFNWPGSEEEKYPEIAAKQLLELRRLKHMYDKERLQYGMKAPFASVNPEDIPEDCRNSGGNGPQEEDSQEEECLM